MAKLSKQEFYDKWVPLLADNVFQDIDGARFEQLLADLRDSFASADSQSLQPVAPAVNFDPVLRQLTATHLLGTSELEYNRSNGGFTAYAPIQVDALGHGQGEWRFRVKAAVGRSASQTTDSPLIEPKGTANPAGPGKIKAADISDSTEAGRALLTAKDVAAQRKLLDNFVILAGQYGVGQPRFEHTAGENGLYAYLLRAISSVGAPAAPTNGQVDDLGDVFSFQPPAGYSFAQLKIAGLPSTTGAEWLNTANCYVQNGRVYVRVFGAVPAGGLSVYVGASGSIPDGLPLTNNAPFTANNVVPTVPGALAVDFTVDNATLGPGDALTFTAKASGGTVPYQHSVQALNPDTGAVVVIGMASTPSFSGAWEKVQPGVYLVTDAVTDAAGGSLVSAARRVVVAAPGSGGGTLVPATRTRLGGVRIGEGLSITEEGLLSADAAGRLAGDNEWTGTNTHQNVVYAPNFIIRGGNGATPGFDSLWSVAQYLEFLGLDVYETFDGFAKPFVVTGQYRWPAGYDTLQEAIDKAPISCAITMQADAPEKPTTFRNCTIYGNGHTIGGLTVQAGAKVNLWADINSTQKEAVYINTGELSHYGHIKHVYAGEEGQSVTIYPSGNYYGRGNMLLDFAKSSSTGIISAGECEIDWEGEMILPNKGRPARPQNGKSRLGGLIVSNDLGVTLARGRCDLFATIDTRNSTSNSPALVVAQLRDAADFGEYHTLHAGVNLLSKPGVPSVVYGNPAIGTHTVRAAQAVCYSQVPDPAQVKIELMGILYGLGSTTTPGTGTGGGTTPGTGTGGGTTPGTGTGGGTTPTPTGTHVVLFSDSNGDGGESNPANPYFTSIEKSFFSLFSKELGCTKIDNKHWAGNGFSTANYAFGGATTESILSIQIDQMVAGWDKVNYPNLIAIVMGGTNDPAHSIPVAQSKANLLAIKARIDSLGGVMIASSAIEPSAHQGRPVGPFFDELNTWLQQNALTTLGAKGFVDFYLNDKINRLHYPTNNDWFSLEMFGGIGGTGNGGVPFDSFHWGNLGHAEYFSGLMPVLRAVLANQAQTPKPTPDAPGFAEFDDLKNTLRLTTVGVVPMQYVRYRLPGGSTWLAAPANGIVTVGDLEGPVTTYSVAFDNYGPSAERESQAFTKAPTGPAVERVGFGDSRIAVNPQYPSAYNVYTDINGVPFKSAGAHPELWFEINNPKGARLVWPTRAECDFGIPLEQFKIRLYLGGNLDPVEYQPAYGEVLFDLPNEPNIRMYSTQAQTNFWKVDLYV